LRGAERHLGRWLVLGEVAAASGDAGPLEEARARSTSGPASARSAWSLVAWALERRTHGAAETSLPDRLDRLARPTVEIVSRLSDRPSADRDTTFLFRMACAGMPSARPMLESLTKELPLSNEVAVRAALFLARDHGRADLAEALYETASSERKDDLRGLATAALSDLRDPTIADEARRLAAELLGSRSLVNVAWGVLVRAFTAARPLLPPATVPPATVPPATVEAGERDERATVLCESAFRWMQWGWLE
jgi:hypothetical protein